MASKSANEGPIDPNMAYTLEQAARHMGINARTLREKLVVTGEISTARLAHSSLTMGWEIIRWVERNMVAAQDELT